MAVFLLRDRVGAEWSAPGNAVVAPARRSIGIRRRRDSDGRNPMSVKIHIPTPLRPYTDKQDVVEVEGNTVGELLDNLTTKFGGLRQHLFNSDGKMRSFVNV